MWLAVWTDVLRLTVSVVPRSAEAAAFAFWALVHGRVELARGPARLAAPDAGLDDAVRALILGFQTGASMPNPLPPHVPSLASLSVHHADSDG